MKCDFCGRKISWLSRHFPPFRVNWYKVDITDKAGHVTKTETACRDCGRLLALFEDMSEEEVAAVLKACDNHDKTNL